MKSSWNLPRPLSLLAATFVVLPWGWCADEEATFLEFQTKYQTFLKETTKPIGDAFQRRLIELEKAAVLKRQYALAAKIKAARASATREIGVVLTETTPVASSPQPTATATLEADGSVTMSAPQATMAGGVTLDAEKNALVGWTTEQSSARWKLPEGLRTGGYEVELTYSCGNGGGSFVIKEDTYSLKRQVKDSGSWMSFRPEVCGVLRVKSSSQQVQISATALVGEGLFYLRQVRLLPCAAL
jgi:hypothetical protein